MKKILSLIIILFISAAIYFGPQVYRAYGASIVNGNLVSQSTVQSSNITRCPTRLTKIFDALYWGGTTSPTERRTINTPLSSSRLLAYLNKGCSFRAVTTYNNATVSYECQRVNYSELVGFGCQSGDGTDQGGIPSQYVGVTFEDGNAAFPGLLTSDYGERPLGDDPGKQLKILFFVKE